MSPNVDSGQILESLIENMAMTRVYVKRRKEAGQTIVLAAVSLVTLLVAAGLAVDMGYLRYQRRNMQSAADSAAIAGATELAYPAAGDVVAAAKADASTNGFTDGSNGITVTVNNPPTNLNAGDPYQNNAGAVEVIVSQNQPTFFMKIVGRTSVPVSAQSVATLGSSKGCIYALGAAGVTYTAAGNVGASCGVVDNGDLNGSGTLTAQSIGVEGVISATGATPAPVPLLVHPTDPLAFLANSVPVPGTPCLPGLISAATPTILFPGTYCGGIALTGTGDVTFSPGVYIVTGGGIQFSGASGLVSGAGVTFYNNGTTAISDTGAQTISLTAPTSGTYAGILFFQDAADTQAATFAGTGTTSLTGALYLPGAAVSLAANSGAAYTIVVANGITFTGSATFGDNYSTLPGGISPIMNALLVE